jgi:hypothetical protein
MVKKLEIATDEKLLTREQAAELLAVQPHTLACWRSEGRGPAIVRFGVERSARVRYRQSEVLRFAADPVAYERERRDVAIQRYPAPAKRSADRGGKAGRQKPAAKR